MKKFLNIILSIIVLVFLFLLVYGYSSKRIITKTVSGIYTKKEVSNNILNYVCKELPELTPNKIERFQKKLEDSNEMDEITTKYLDGIIKSILTNKRVEVEINQEVDSLIDTLAMDVGSEIRNLIKTEAHKINFNQQYQYMLDVSNERVNPQMKKALQVYNKVSNATFEIGIMFLILIAYILLIIINKSIIKGTKVLSLIFIVFGVSNSVITYLINRNMYSITNRFIGTPSAISLDALEKTSLLLLVIGAIIYSIIHVIVTKIQKED